MKLISMFIIVLLKIETFLLTLMLRKALSQLKSVTACLINKIVKIRSMDEEEDSIIWVASLIFWPRPNWDITFSIVIPSKLVLSWLH